MTDERKPYKSKNHPQDMREEEIESRIHQARLEHQTFLRKYTPTARWLYNVVGVGRPTVSLQQDEELEFLRGFFIRLMASYHLEGDGEDDVCPILCEEMESKEAQSYLSFLKAEDKTSIHYCGSEYEGAADLWERLPVEKARRVEELKQRHQKWQAECRAEVIRAAKEAKELDEAFGPFMNEVAAMKARRQGAPHKR